MPEYERGERRGVSVALLPLSSELNSLSSGTQPHPSPPEELDTQTAYFTDKGRLLFSRLFGLSLQQVMAGKVLDLSTSFDPSAATFKRQKLPTSSKDSLDVLVPDKPIQLQDESAEFLLLVDQIVFTPRAQTTKAGMLGSTKEDDSLFLGVRCKYVLYDNRKGQVAAYGTFEQEKRTLAPTSPKPYQALLGELATHIVTYSPMALSGGTQI